MADQMASSVWNYLHCACGREGVNVTRGTLKGTLCRREGTDELLVGDDELITLITFVKLIGVSAILMVNVIAAR